MIHTLACDGGPVAAFEVKGKLTHDDYRERIVPRLERLIAEHPRPRCLFVLGSGYQGITVGAMWEDLKVGIRHRKDFDRIAVVADDSFVRTAVRLFGPLVRGDLRLFRTAEQPEAEAWVQETAAGSTSGVVAG